MSDYQSLKSEGKTNNPYKGVIPGKYNAVIKIINKDKEHPSNGKYLMIGWELLGTPEESGKMVFESFYLNHPEEEKKDMARSIFERELVEFFFSEVPDELNFNIFAGKEAILDVINTLSNGRVFTKITKKYRSTDESLSQLNNEKINDEIPF